MTKSLITRVWIGGLADFAAGIVVAIIGIFLMLAYGGTFTQVADTGYYNFNPDMNGFLWVTGGLIGLIGSIVQFVASVGGLINSYRLPDKAWFFVLLLGGVLSLGFAPIGFAAMIAYLIAAPDVPAQYRLETPTATKPRGAGAHSLIPSLARGRVVHRPAPDCRHRNANVAVSPERFSVTYRTDQRDKEIDLVTDVGNPGPGSAVSSDRSVPFRHAMALKYRPSGYAEYFVYDPTDQTSNRWLMWIEPGTSTAAGTPQSGVPYFLFARGLTDAEFWQVANSLG